MMWLYLTELLFPLQNVRKDTYIYSTVITIVLSRHFNPVWLWGRWSRGTFARPRQRESVVASLVSDEINFQQGGNVLPTVIVGVVVGDSPTSVVNFKESPVLWVINRYVHPLVIEDAIKLMHGSDVCPFISSWAILPICCQSAEL